MSERETTRSQSSRNDFAYNATVMDHFQNPRNAGEIDNPDAIAETRNPNCGDAISLSIKVTGDIISEVKFLTFGCGAAIACSSVATEMVKGKKLDEISTLSRDEVAAKLNGLPLEKMACSNLAPDAIRAAIENYKANLQEG